MRKERTSGELVPVVFVGKAVSAGQKEIQKQLGTRGKQWSKNYLGL